VNARCPRAAGAWLALAAALWIGAQAAALRAEEPLPEDPPLCRDALAASPELPAQAALERAEQQASKRAREARRAAQKLLRGNLGAGAQGGLAGADAADALLRQEADARRQGKALCHCRQRRGDPNREDCEFLYPERL
jgi:hypothetical protein